MGKTKRRTEPTYPETCADDLWLAVKFQSNSDIAGSPRNRFRPSLEVKLYGGRATECVMASSRGTEHNQTPNAIYIYSGVSVWVITSIRERKTIQTAN